MSNIKVEIASTEQIENLKDLTKELVEGLGQKFDPKRFDWGIRRRLFDPLQRHGILIAVDEDYDLCIIRREKHGIVPLKLVGDYKNVRIGDRVAIFGSPLAVFPVRTEGSVIIPRKDIPRRERLGGRLVLSAPVASGNSGGPVVNEKGEVIGVLVEVNMMYHHISI